MYRKGVIGVLITQPPGVGLRGVEASSETSLPQRPFRRFIFITTIL